MLTYSEAAVVICPGKYVCTSLGYDKLGFWFLRNYLQQTDGRAVGFLRFLHRFLMVYIVENTFWGFGELKRNMFGTHKMTPLKQCSVYWRYAIIY